MTAPEWEPPEPRQLPWLRARLAEQMNNPYEHKSLALMLEQGRGTINPAPDSPHAAARMLLHDEYLRLASAPLYYVTADMTHIATQAGAKLPSWNVRRDDIPTRSGFMVFETPLATYAPDSPWLNQSTGVQIVGVSWGSTELVNEPDEHVWVTFWSLTDREADIASVKAQVGLKHAEARKMSHEIHAELSWDNECLLTFNSPNVHVSGSGAIDPSEANLVAETTASWMQTVRATWLLMRSTGDKAIADIAEEPLPRTLRRQAQRQGMDSSPVTVVRLHQRRVPQREAAHASGYHVSVRSHVTGHVRWQPYPSRDAIEPIWIEPHVRGPEGAPFKQQHQKVTVLDRPPKK